MGISRLVLLFGEVLQLSMVQVSEACEGVIHSSVSVERYLTALQS
jgi:hypothetical protein